MDETQARAAVLEANVCEDRPCAWCDEKRPAVEAALDAYKRAVIAALPCYQIYEAFADDWVRFAGESQCDRAYPCPTCTERAAQAEWAKDYERRAEETA